MSGSGGYILVFFRKLAACALIVAICFGLMPQAFANNFVASTIGLLVGVSAAAWVGHSAKSLGIAIPIGVGSIVCTKFDVGVPDMLLSLNIALFAGVILYIACGIILPDKKKRQY